MCDRRRWVMHRTAFSNVAPAQRQAEQQSQTPKREISHTPASTCDDGLRYDRQDHRAQACADHDKSHRGTQSPLKPGGDGASKGEMGRAVPHKTNQDAGCVKLPQGRAQQGQRNDAAAVESHAGKDDAARSEAVDQPPNERRSQTDSHGGEAKAERDRFAVPAKLRAQRLYKNGEGVHEERAKAGHDSKAGS